jgi:hypothetical protein
MEIYELGVYSWKMAISIKGMLGQTNKKASFNSNSI